LFNAVINLSINQIYHPINEHFRQENIDLISNTLLNNNFFNQQIINMRKIQLKLKFDTFLIFLIDAPTLNEATEFYDIFKINVTNYINTHNDDNNNTLNYFMNLINNLQLNNMYNENDDIKRQINKICFTRSLLCSNFFNSEVCYNMLNELL
jgi:hypothetical protein